MHARGHQPTIASTMDHSHNHTCGFTLNEYTANLTASYTDKRNELSTVPASLIMFILTGLFFNLNLFSGISDVSAILEPKVRFVLSSVLSLFLPVMSYLFSEAKDLIPENAGTMAGLSLRARLILAWMLLVELLRRKVDEIRMRGYSSTVQRAGRVVWLGSLVFFNISAVGQRALFSVLWILCATRLLQRVVFTEVEKRSYAHGKNAGLVNSYMAQMLQQDQRHVVEDELLIKRCKYVVMGEEKLVKKVTAYGYELNDITTGDSIITVGKVWQLAESDRLFTALDGNQHLRRLCLSFALFKLLRRRFEHLPAAASAEEAHDSRDLLLKGLYSSSSSETTAEAVFQVMNDEVNFLCEYNHSVAPVVLASPFFLLVNYFLIHVAVFGFCIMSILLCGNGDVTYTLRSIISENNYYSLGSLLGYRCLLIEAIKSPAAFFFILDLFITIILLILLFYEEIWEFLIFLLSNWFMVSLLCNYMIKPKWRESLTFSGAFRFLMLLRSKTRNTNFNFKQFYVLDLCWPPILALPATLSSLKVKTAPVPNKLKQSIMEYMVEHDRGTSYYTPLTNGKTALRRNNLSDQLCWACNSSSLAEVTLTWHIATCLLEVECPQEAPGSSMVVAMKLSKYCAYLVLFHPELLPDNQENVELFFEDIIAELKSMLGSWDYYFSSRQARVKKIMESARGEDTTETTDRREIQVETTTDWREIQVETTTGLGHQNKVVTSGAKLGKLLMDQANNSGPETVWKVLADVWTELIIYTAATTDKERVRDVLVHGGDFITLLWALTTHTGIQTS